MFNSPNALEYHGTGDLYIVESRQHIIRRINLRTLTLSTFIGSDSAEAISGQQTGSFSQTRMKSPAGIFAEKDHIYIVDTGNQIILQTNTR